MAGRGNDMKAHLLATFRVEAEEHLQAITSNLLALDRGLPPAEASQTMEATFRGIHTLKGAARTVSLAPVEEICQAAESLLSRLTRGHLEMTRPMLNGLREAVDGVARLLTGGESGEVMAGLIRRLEQAAAGPSGDAPAVLARQDRPSAEASSAPETHGLPPADTIRLDRSRLDAVLLRAEELLFAKLAVEERVREAEASVEALAAVRAAGRRIRNSGATAAAQERDPDSPSSLDAAMRMAESQARAMLGHLAADQRTIAAVVTGLLDEMRRLRMTSASTILELLSPMVRSLAAEQGKEVEWVSRGADLEVDRKVLETVKDPLIHLVRNAVDHGIELPDERLRAGKPRRGQVAVTLDPLEGGRVEIRVEDDGRGIDSTEVKAAAVRARILTPDEARALPDEEVLDLIFRSGLSTAPIITHVSGHGLGMPIVKECVERLGGHVRAETRAGCGTTMRMILPTTIASSRGLLVREGENLFLLPAEAVERALRVARGALQKVGGRDAIPCEGRPIFVSRLADLLGVPLRPEGSDGSRTHDPCVIVASGEERIGLLVEEILGEREVLVRELRPPLVRVRNVAGVGLLGTGHGVLILRPTDLLRTAREGPRAQAPVAEPDGEARRPAIMVVDDSITTRTMERNVLEAAGYQVQVAADGMEAWTSLKTAAFDLIVSDVDMPRLDGFGLTARIRADRELADLPVVLVTALESREDKEKGIEVGANAYVIKSSFDQSNLLEIIRRLL